jgi:hypothetical protein
MVSTVTNVKYVSKVSMSMKVVPWTESQHTHYIYRNTVFNTLDSDEAGQSVISTVHYALYLLFYNLMIIEQHSDILD